MNKMDEQFTRLSNDIVEALSRTNLTAYEWRVLMVIFRKTYGHQKKEDWIAPSQIVSATGMHKAHVSRSKRLLILRNIVTQRGNKLSFNKYHSQWKQLPNGVTNHGSKTDHRYNKPKKEKKLPIQVTREVTQRGTEVTQRGISELPNGADTKETLTKENNTKENVPTEHGNAGVNAIINAMQECFGNLDGTKAKNRQYAWLLLKKAKSLQSGATDEDALQSCVQLIRAASQHKWWGSRITRVEQVYKNAHMITKAIKEQLSTPSSHVNL